MTASHVIGVAAAGSGKPEVLIAGLAGLVAGAMSMAAGEYVSVSSQTDAEQADFARETRELAETPEAELEELIRIYVDRGLDCDLAEKVAHQLTERDALGTHARDELGISETVTARPIQAALVSFGALRGSARLPRDYPMVPDRHRPGSGPSPSAIFPARPAGNSDPWARPSKGSRAPRHSPNRSRSERIFRSIFRRQCRLRMQEC